MVSNTSFNSITSSDKQAVQSIGSSHPNFVESNDVERGERCICQLLSRNDNSIPIQIEEEIVDCEKWHQNYEIDPTSISSQTYQK